MDNLFSDGHTHSYPFYFKFVFFSQVLVEFWFCSLSSGMSSCFPNGQFLLNLRCHTLCIDLLVVWIPVHQSVLYTLYVICDSYRETFPGIHPDYQKYWFISFKLRAIQFDNKWEKKNSFICQIVRLQSSSSFVNCALAGNSNVRPPRIYHLQAQLKICTCVDLCFHKKFCSLHYFYFLCINFNFLWFLILSFSFKNIRLISTLIFSTELDVIWWTLVWDYGNCW